MDSESTGPSHSTQLPADGVSSSYAGAEQGGSGDTGTVAAVRRETVAQTEGPSSPLDVPDPPVSLPFAARPGILNDSLATPVQPESPAALGQTAHTADLADQIERLRGQMAGLEQSIRTGAHVTDLAQRLSWLTIQVSSLEERLESDGRDMLADQVERIGRQLLAVETYLHGELADTVDGLRTRLDAFAGTMKTDPKTGQPRTDRQFDGGVFAFFRSAWKESEEACKKLLGDGIIFMAVVLVLLAFYWILQAVRATGYDKDHVDLLEQLHFWALFSLLAVIMCRLILAAAVAAWKGITGDNE